MSGTLTSNYATISNLASTGSTLNNSIISLSGLFTGYTGTLDATFASDTQLANTGTTLDSSINSLSGTLTSTYATISNLASTGSTLDTKINNLSGSSVLLYGDQSVSGVKTFANNISVQGTGIFDALDLSNISDFSFSGVTINLINSTVQSSGGNFIVYGSGNFTSGLDLNNSKLINSIPEIINLSTNFNISGNYNSRMIMVNSATEVTGRIVSGNSLGFNATIMQVGVGQVLITGSGIGINIGSFNNQYRTAGQFAAVSVLHTGNNGYTMYGNTAA